MPRVRARQRRTLRHLGRPVRARAPSTQETSGLIHSHVRVTAVVVAHNGARFLPATLQALTGQSRPVDHYIGIDASSADDSAALLAAGLPSGAPIVHTPAHGFGASVRAGLDGGARLPEAREDTQDWIWLIHDDSAPHPQALARLLEAVETSPSVTIAGCKQLDRERERRLLDVGLSVSRWGERLTLVDVDELDQGQYDGRTDSFAVNSAGLLVRRDAWTLLDGFDPALPGLGDDIDLCWRNRLAGHRVVVVPQARMFHAPDTVHSIAGPLASRRAEVYLRLKHAPGWKLPLVALGAILGSVFRLLVSLVSKDPGYGFGQLNATLGAVFSPLKLAASRRCARATRRHPRKIVRKLMVPRREAWAYRRNLLEGADTEAVVGDGTGSMAEPSNPSGDSSNDFAALAARNRTSSGVSALVAVILAATASLIGLRTLLGGPALAGGSMLPLGAPGAIWRTATGWWQSIGAGVPGHGDPFDMVLGVLALLGLGHANAALLALVLAAMPLAALFAWLALGALTSSRLGRLLGALLWAVAPALQVALGSGRAGAVVVHVFLPLVALGAIRAVGAARASDEDDADAAPSGTAQPFVPSGTAPLPAPDGRPSTAGVRGVPSWTAAAGAALALAVVTAASPALLPLAVVLTIAFAVPLGRRAKALWWIPVPSLVLALPGLPSFLANPRILLADPGVPQAFTPAPLWQQALGFPVAFDPAASVQGFGWAASMVPGPWALVAALVIGVPVLAVAVGALFVRGRRGGVARAAWFAGLLALAAGYAAQAVPFGVAGDRWVTAFTGPFVSLFVLGALLGAAAGYDALRAARRSGRDASRRAERPAGSRPLATAVLAASVIATLASIAVAGTLWLVPRIVEPPRGGSTADAALPASGADATAGIDAGPAEQATPEGGVEIEDFGAGQLLEPVSDRTLPATAADRGNGPLQDRTLVMAPAGESGGMSATLMSGGGTTLDQLSGIDTASRLAGSPWAPSLAADDGATTALRETVAALVSGQAIDPRTELERLGVSFIVLQAGDDPGSVLASKLDGVPGLAAVGHTDSGWLWRVEPTAPIAGTSSPTDFTSRVRVLDAEGHTVRLLGSNGTRVRGAEIPNGPAGRTVVVAARADAGWHASLDGRELTATTNGWAQAFELPARAGVLEVGYTSIWSLPAKILMAVVFLATLLLVIPIPQRRRFAARRVEEYRTAGSAETIREIDDSGEPDDGHHPEDPARTRGASAEPAADTAEAERGGTGRPPAAAQTHRSLQDTTAGKHSTTQEEDR